MATHTTGRRWAVVLRHRPSGRLLVDGAAVVHHARTAIGAGVLAARLNRARSRSDALWVVADNYPIARQKVAAHLLTPRAT